jgi:hypothetical protein
LRFEGAQLGPAIKLSPVGIERKFFKRIPQFNSSNLAAAAFGSIAQS